MKSSWGLATRQTVWKKEYWKFQSDSKSYQKYSRGRCGRSQRFCFFCSSTDASVGFSNEPDCFGHSSRVSSHRHRSSFIKGQELVKESTVQALIVEKEDQIFFPSSKLLKFLADLVGNRRIAGTLSAKKRRLLQLLPVHLEMLCMDNPEVWEAENQTVTPMDYYWYCTMVYHLRPCVPDPENLQESWRRGRKIPSERESYRFYTCSCPRFARSAFCKHTFALGLMKGKCEVPISRSMDIIGSQPTRGRPRLSLNTNR